MTTPITANKGYDASFDPSKAGVTIVDGMPTASKIDSAPYPFNGTKFPDGSYFDKDRQYHPASKAEGTGENLDLQV